MVTKSKKQYFYRALAVFVIILITVSICLFLTASQEKNTARDYHEIENEGILRVATTYSPVGYFVSGDTISGFNYDMINLLKKQTSLDIEIVLKSDIKSMIDALISNECDLIIANIPITNQIKDSLNLTKPVTQNKLVLVQRKAKFNNDKAPIRSHLELAGCTIYVANHSPAIIRIENMASEIGDSIFHVEDPLYSNEQLAMKVASGEINYSIIDDITAKKMIAELPEIDCDTEIGFTHFEAWVLRKDSPILLDSVNIWIDRIKQQPDYSKIYNKYYK